MCQTRTTLCLGLARVLLVLCLTLYPLSVSALPAFPGASGFGSDTPGGSGRHAGIPANTTVYKVTNLNASGSGSLRACVQASGPRVCVFEVSGVIVDNARLTISNPYITIAGQTAPAPGIFRRNSSIVVQTHDVVIQHITNAAGPNGDENVRDTLSFYGNNVNNVIVDHCTILWGMDENIDAFSGTVRNITISRTLNAENVNPSHRFGASWGGRSSATGELFPVKFTTLHHNLWTHFTARNPKTTADSRIEWINNVRYNAINHGCDSAMHITDQALTNLGSFYTFVGNYDKNGPDDTNNQYSLCGTQAQGLPLGTRIYVDANINTHLRPTDSGDDWAIVAPSLSNILYRALTPAFTLSNVNIDSAQEAYASIVEDGDVGSRPADRVALNLQPDTRIIAEARTGTGRLKDCISGCSKDAGGWPSRANNTRALNIPANPGADDNGNGYTNLEDWLHTFLDEVELGGADNVAPAPPRILSVTVFSD